VALDLEDPVLPAQSAEAPNVGHAERDTKLAVISLADIE
jgi:hypothetical protein